MTCRCLTLLAFIILSTSAAAGQQPYDLLLKGGRVLDPANQLDAVLDVAVKDGRIARVAAGIPSAQARKTVEVAGLLVVPGLVDLHAHAWGTNLSIFPDDSALPAGTTTILDCGGPGWRNFEDYKARIIERAKTRILVFINIVGHGMGGDEDNVDDMDPRATADMILKHRNLIVGIKNAHFGRTGWASIERAVEAGRLSNTPVILDNGILSWTGRTTEEKVLKYMRPGDIHTHMYNDRHVEIVHRRTGKVHPYMRQARERGVLFDMGHGNGSFLWPAASAAMQDGFPPDTISTDLHAASILSTQSDMPNCISKMMLLGMSLPEAIFRSTARPAQVIGHYPEIGTLGVGKTADIAVLRHEQGVFAFQDAWRKKRLGTERVLNVLTVRAGEIVFDRDGIAFPEWTSAGEYEWID